MKYFVIILILSLISGLSCSNPIKPKQKNNGVLTLSLVDKSCTEAWIEFKAQNISFPAKISFLLDDKPYINKRISSEDTTVYTAGQLLTDGPVNKVVISGNYAYTIKPFRIIDISDLLYLKLVKTLQFIFNIRNNLS